MLRSALRCLSRQTVSARNLIMQRNSLYKQIVEALQNSLQQVTFIQPKGTT